MTRSQKAGEASGSPPPRVLCAVVWSIFPQDQTDEESRNHAPDGMQCPNACQNGRQAKGEGRRAKYCVSPTVSGRWLRRVGFARRDAMDKTSPRASRVDRAVVQWWLTEAAASGGKINHLDTAAKTQPLKPRPLQQTHILTIEKHKQAK